MRRVAQTILPVTKWGTRHASRPLFAKRRQQGRANRLGEGNEKNVHRQDCLCP